MLVLPVKFSFFEESYFVWDLAENVMDFFFVVDIVLNFVTAYYDEEEEILVISRKKIICKYLKFWFWVDSVSVIPFQLMVNNGGLSIFLRISKLPRLYKILKISKLVRTVRAGRSQQDSIWNKLYNTIKLNPGIDRLILNLFSIFLFCHIFACLWHFFAWNSNSIDNWITVLNLRDTNAWYRYLSSLYWIVQTVVTVGYGDIIISNTLERFIAILAMFAGVLFFSVIIGSLTTLISDMDKRGSEFEHKISTLIMVKSKHKISDDTYNKIIRAIKY